jgi:hypothetical protein
MQGSMGKSAAYGLGGALVAFLLGSVAPQPWGSIVLWSLLGLQSLRFAYLLLRRTTMYTAAAGGLCMALSCMGAVMAYTSGARPLDRMATAIPMITAGVIGLLLTLVVTPRVYKDQWARWREYQGRLKHGLWDFVLLRNLPDLRHSV